MRFGVYFRGFVLLVVSNFYGREKSRVARWLDVGFGFVLFIRRVCCVVEVFVLFIIEIFSVCVYVVVGYVFVGVVIDIRVRFIFVVVDVIVCFILFGVIIIFVFVEVIIL